ncbi:MAG: hypothetical protein A2033_13430 [Bacteroidetes bacterium GWA2_31_9]|nr:MAG: hypothetical protein A2033_13430 [Bacteroidetes bacterium GWA2_31_9]
MWYYKTNWDFEPLVTMLTLLGVLISMIIYKKIGNVKNQIKIQGNENIAFQKGQNINDEKDVSNNANIEGNNNIVSQN